jgi:autophagy-related protein 2
VENESEPYASMHNNTFFSRHNDDTYMDRIGLSQNQNQFDGVIDDDLPEEKDIFTTNGPGFSHYHSLVASINAEKNESFGSGIISTMVHAHCGSIRLSFFPIEEHLFPNEDTEEQEYIVCSIDHFDFLHKSGATAQNSTIQVNRWSIDYGVDDVEGQHMLPIVGFPAFVAKDDDALISDSIALIVTINDTNDGEDECVTNRYIYASIQPMCITLWKSVILNIASDFQKILLTLENTKSPDNSRINELRIISKTYEIVCEHISVRLPTEHERRESISYNALFSRCGYNESQDILAAFLGIDISQFQLTLVDLGADSNAQDEDLTLQVLFEEAVGYVAEKSQRFDIFSLESETKIDSNAIVKIEWKKSKIQRKSEGFKKDRIKTIFPTVVLLSTVKSSQQEENENQPFETSPEECSKGKKKPIRRSDPSKEMMRTASKTEGVLIIHIPSLSVDISKVERIILMKLLVFMSESKGGGSSHLRDSPQKSQYTVSLNIHCDQCSLTLHEDNVVESSSDSDRCSFMIVADSFRFHSVFQDGDLMQVRALFSDLTLFEGTGCRFDQNLVLISEDLGVVQKKCVRLKRRRWKSDASSRAIFFRSKLSCPLSPDTPCIHIDFICRREEDQMDVLLYAFVYDMTHRFDVENHWIDRLTSHFISDAVEPDLSTTSDSNTSNIVTIFLTASNCNIDYTSSERLQTESRIIAHIGEFRITSNIMTPKEPLPQLYKLSMADVELFVTNSRVKHDTENANLSCSKLIFGEAATLSNLSSNVIKSFESALSSMKFKRILALESLDSCIEIESQGNIVVKPSRKTITLTFGQVSMYSCKDSFVCFTETLNEMILLMTMPSPSELAVMREEFERNRKTTVAEREDENDLHNFQGDYVYREPFMLSNAMEHSIFSSEIEVGQSPSDKDDSKPYNASLISDFFDVQLDPDGSFEKQILSHGDDFDSDDWTNVHHSWAFDTAIPDGEEQAARWYDFTSNEEDDIIYPSKDSFSNLIIPHDARVVIDGNSSRRPRLISHHVPDDFMRDPLTLGDMEAANFIGTNEPPDVNFRIIIFDLNVDCRFFGGYDWTPKSKGLDTENLMDELVGEDDDKPTSTIFSGARDMNKMQGRQTQTYFQVSCSKIKLRLDSFVESENHHLASCTNISVGDIAIIETVSGRKPVKLLGEWINEDQPRDSNDGMLMMKMFSVKPVNSFSSDGNLIGNEAHVTMEFIPLRFFIHQVGIRFIRDFFRSNVDASDHESETQTFVKAPELFFPMFLVKPLNIKVDYKPKVIDTAALKDGSLVELLNVLPLEDMILRLAEVEMRNLSGWGSIISELVCSWLQDISSSQMHKFLTRTTPLHPIASVGDGMKQFLMIPIEEYRQKGNLKKGLRKGTKKLASVLAYEALSVGARISGFAAKKLNRTRRIADSNSAQTTSLPRSMGEVSDQAIESLARGFKEANSKMIIIQYREYKLIVTRGAMTSVVRGIPVAVCAPLSGAAEAVSYSLYGVRNQIRPDLREEEEASKLLHDCNY